MFRSQELQKIADKTTAVLDESNETTHDAIINELCSDVPTMFPEKVMVGESVHKDLDLREWYSSYAITRGGKVVLDHIISNPIADIDNLNKRADIVAAFPEISISPSINDIRDLETTILWALSLPTQIKDAWPMHLLFPSWPIVRYVNFIPWLLFGIHMFKGYVSPVLNVAYPVSSILAPYYYLKRYMRFDITMSQYIYMLRMAAMMMLRPTGDLKQNATKYVSVIIYVVLFLYGIIQGFDMAYLIRKMRKELYKKMERLTRFVATYKQLIGVPAAYAAVNLFHGDLPQVDDLNCDMTSFYKLVTDETLRSRLKQMLKNVYIIDAFQGMHSISMQQGWSRCVWKDTGATRLWGMGHPLIPFEKQVRNPLSLDRNLIITGPNAAGKTTYMKSVCANMILAQSIGYVSANRNEIVNVHAISTSIRVHDSVGSESLFEAEVRRCATIVRQARDLSKNGMRALYFLDEPMHSTPPTEGAATAMSIASFIGTLEGIRLFMTTHYHEVTRLEDMHPQTWKNISMEAKSDGDACSYRFPYKIRCGPSFQCIALEILKDRELPDEIIKTAIEMKNKICEVVVDQYAS